MDYFTSNNQASSHTNSSHSSRHNGSTRNSSRNKHSLRLDIMTEPCLRGDNLEYDEVDLVSECSSPVAYVPGRYLQLCDLSPVSDATIWPVSLGPKVSDGDVIPLMSSPTHRGDAEQCLHSIQHYRKSPRLSLTNPRLLVPIAVCIFLAFSALGGLAMMI